MKRTLIIAVIGLVAVGGLIAAAMLMDQSDSAPLLKPLVELNTNASNVAATPTAVMSDTERFAVDARYMTPSFDLYPNQYDDGANDRPSDLPASFTHIISVPFHGSKSVIRVYAALSCTVDGKPAGRYSALSPGDLSGDCLGDKVLVYKYDPTKAKSETIGELDMFSGGNYGGVFVPLALSKDDQNIILTSVMGSPGAGGGGVDLGYSYISAIPGIYSSSSKNLPTLTSSEAIFYDSFGKVVSLEEGAQTPDWVQPGRQPNQGTILYQDLLTGKKTVLAAAPDTYYEIRGFDESKRTLDIQAVANTYTADCPRSTEALDCSTKTAVNATLQLP